MKTFDNEWIVHAFEDDPSFFTKRMFGGLAVYLFGRQMMVLVEPTKTGRWQWHGVLICTDHAHHRAIIAEFPQFAPHDVLKKWLYIDSRTRISSRRWNEWRKPSPGTTRDSEFIRAPAGINLPAPVELLVLSLPYDAGKSIDAFRLGCFRAATGAYALSWPATFAL